MKAQAKNCHEQNMQEIFAQELDQIFYPGYSEDLIASEPEKFIWEFNEFSGQFTKN